MGGPTVELIRKADATSEWRDGAHLRDYKFPTLVAYARSITLPPYASLPVTDLDSADQTEHYMYIAKGHLLVRKGAPDESDEFHEAFAGDAIRAVERCYELANVGEEPALIFQVILGH